MIRKSWNRGRGKAIKVSDSTDMIPCMRHRKTASTLRSGIMSSTTIHYLPNSTVIPVEERVWASETLHFQIRLRGLTRQSNFVHE